MNAKILTNELDILKAQQLLYKIYVEEQQWNIKENNPSGLKVVLEKEFYRLCDHHDKVATWFGVFDKHELIACHRHCTRLNGHFELESYHHLPDFIKKDKVSIETNRLAIKKEYRSSIVLPLLLELEYSYGLQQKYGHFFTTGYYPSPGKMYINKFGLIKYGSSFRYHDDDIDDVFLYYINFQVKDKVTQVINYLNNIINRLRLRSC